MEELSSDEHENVFLDMWFHAKKKDKESIKDLFSFANFLLQVHGCLHQ